MVVPNKFRATLPSAKWVASLRVARQRVRGCVAGFTKGTTIGGIGQTEIMVGLVVDLQGFKGFQAIEGRHYDHSLKSARLRTEGTDRAFNLAPFER